VKILTYSTRHGRHCAGDALFVGGRHVPGAAAAGVAAVGGSVVGGGVGVGLVLDLGAGFVDPAVGLFAEVFAHWDKCALVYTLRWCERGNDMREGTVVYLCVYFGRRAEAGAAPARRRHGEDV